MEIIELVRTYLSGIMTSFFILLTIYNYFYAFRAQNEKSRKVYYLVCMALGGLGLQCVLRFLVDVYVNSTHLAYPDMVDYYYCILSIIDPMVIPSFAMSLVMVTTNVRHPIRQSLFAMIPMVAALIAYIFIKDISVFWILTAYNSLLIVATFVVLHISVTKYQHALTAVFSNLHRRDARWVLVVAYMLLVQYVLWLVLDNNFFLNEYSNSLYYLVSLVIWSMYAIFIHRQNLESEAMGELMELRMPNADDMPEEMLSTPLAMVQLDNKVYEYCVLEQHYLNPDLNVNDLAKEVGATRANLTKWFNKYGESFNSYINNLRINHAIQLMKHQGETLTTVWMKSGFSTASAFNNAFKTKYGCSAAEYMTIQNTEKIKI